MTTHRYDRRGTASQPWQMSWSTSFRRGLLFLFLTWLISLFGELMKVLLDDFMTTLVVAFVLRLCCLSRRRVRHKSRGIFLPSKTGAAQTKTTHNTQPATQRNEELTKIKALANQHHLYYQPWPRHPPNKPPPRQPRRQLTERRSDPRSASSPTPRTSTRSSSKSTPTPVSARRACPS